MGREAAPGILTGEPTFLPLPFILFPSSISSASSEVWCLRMKGEVGPVWAPLGEEGRERWWHTFNRALDCC